MNLKSLRATLEAEKAKLVSELASLGRKNPAVEDDWEQTPVSMEGESDLIDQAEVVVTRETTSAIFADLEARYDTVLMALRRMDEGTYGVCEVCGQPIEETRLVADPAATTCVEHR